MNSITIAIEETSSTTIWFPLSRVMMHLASTSIFILSPLSLSLGNIQQPETKPCDTGLIEVFHPTIHTYPDADKTYISNIVYSFLILATAIARFPCSHTPIEITNTHINRISPFTRFGMSFHSQYPLHVQQISPTFTPPVESGFLYARAFG